MTELYPFVLQEFIVGDDYDAQVAAGVRAGYHPHHVRAYLDSGADFLLKPAHSDFMDCLHCQHIASEIYKTTSYEARGREAWAQLLSKLSSMATRLQQIADGLSPSRDLTKEVRSIQAISSDLCLLCGQ